MRVIAPVVTALAAALIANAASAGIVVDVSPDVIGQSQSFVALNTTGGQNFLVEFTLASATTLTGIDIYSSCCPSLGDAVTVKIRNDNGGVPDTSNLFSYLTMISVIDSAGALTSVPNTRRHADFTATALAAGTYWIGLSGASQIGWSTFGTNSPASQWQLQGDNLQVVPQIGRFAFRLSDDAVPGIPEPATWAMMIIGFGAAGSVIRRRKAVVA